MTVAHTQNVIRNRADVSTLVTRSNLSVGLNYTLLCHIKRFVYTYRVFIYFEGDVVSRPINDASLI